MTCWLILGIGRNIILSAPGEYFERVRREKLTLKRRKCDIRYQVVDLSGHNVGLSGGNIYR